MASSLGGKAGVAAESPNAVHRFIALGLCQFLKVGIFQYSWGKYNTYVHFFAAGGTPKCQE